MKIASLDLGSNTTLMLISEITDGKLKPIRDESTVTRMGQEIAQTGELHLDALVRLDDCLRHYRSIIDQERVDKVVSVATSAARDASNSEKLFELAHKYEVPIQVIEGSKEAEITYLGSTFDQVNPESCFVIDIGGGSTEMVAQNDDGAIKGLSLNMGSVRVIDMFIKEHPVHAESIHKASQFIDDLIDKNIALSGMAKGRKAVAVAGTPTTLTMLCKEIDFDEEQVHGFAMPIETVTKLRQTLQGLSIEQRKQMPGMPPKRADVIVAGTLILERIMKKLSFQKITVSTKGVRYGLALQAAES